MLSAGLDARGSTSSGRQEMEDTDRFGTSDLIKQVLSNRLIFLTSLSSSNQASILVK